MSPLGVQRGERVHIPHELATLARNVRGTPRCIVSADTRFHPNNRSASPQGFCDAPQFAHPDVPEGLERYRSEPWQKALSLPGSTRRRKVLQADALVLNVLGR